MKNLDNHDVPFAFVLHIPFVQYAPLCSFGVIRRKLTKLENLYKIAVIFSARVTFCVTSQPNAKDRLRDP